MEIKLRIPAVSLRTPVLAVVDGAGRIPGKIVGAHAKIDVGTASHFVALACHSAGKGKPAASGHTMEVAVVRHVCKHAAAAGTRDVMRNAAIFRPVENNFAAARAADCHAVKAGRACIRQGKRMGRTAMTEPDRAPVVRITDAHIHRTAGNGAGGSALVEMNAVYVDDGLVANA